MNTEKHIWYVVCDDYRSHPTTKTQAVYLKRSIEDTGLCKNSHSIRKLYTLEDAELESSSTEHIVS